MFSSLPQHTSRRCSHEILKFLGRIARTWMGKSRPHFADRTWKSSSRFRATRIVWSVALVVRTCHIGQTARWRWGRGNPVIASEAWHEQRRSQARSNDRTWHCIALDKSPSFATQIFDPCRTTFQKLYELPVIAAGGGIKQCNLSCTRFVYEIAWMNEWLYTSSPNRLQRMSTIY